MERTKRQYVFRAFSSKSVFFMQLWLSNDPFNFFKFIASFSLDLTESFSLDLTDHVRNFISSKSSQFQHYFNPLKDKKFYSKFYFSKRVNLHKREDLAFKINIDIARLKYFENSFWIYTQLYRYIAALENLNTMEICENANNSSSHIDSLFLVLILLNFSTKLSCNMYLKEFSMKVTD